MRAALGGALLLVGALLTACGGGGGAPADASEEEFCTAYNKLYDNLGDLASGDDKGAIEGMKDWGDTMAEVGTPEDAPEDARQGFDLLLQALDDVDPDASAEDLQQIGEDFSADEQKDIDAFSGYATETCPMEMPELPDLEDEMSDLESQMEDQMGELTESP